MRGGGGGGGHRCQHRKQKGRPFGPTDRLAHWVLDTQDRCVKQGKSTKGSAYTFASLALGLIAPSGPSLCAMGSPVRQGFWFHATHIRDPTAPLRTRIEWLPSFDVAVPVSAWITMHAKGNVPS